MIFPQKYSHITTLPQTAVYFDVAQKLRVISEATGTEQNSFVTSKSPHLVREKSLPSGVAVVSDIVYCVKLKIYRKKLNGGIVILAELN